MLETYFESFADFLATGRRESLAGHLDEGAEPAFLEVYRNGFLRTCTEVLRASYPSVRGLVGEECFKTIARHHVERHPPSEPCLAVYGERFCDTVESRLYVHGLAYLGSVARLDRAWTEVYFAADDDGTQPAAFAAISEETMMRLRGALVPRARLLSLQHSALAAWARLRDDGPRVPSSIAHARQYALVWRRATGIVYREIGAPEHALLTGIAAGRALAEAAEDALDNALDNGASFDVSAAFASLLADRLLIVDTTEPYGESR